MNPLSTNAERVLASLANVSSARRVDLMRWCNLSRDALTLALDELARAGRITTHSHYARYSIRQPARQPA